MVPAIIEAVKREFPSVFTFLDSRLIKGNYISADTQPPFNEKYLMKNETIGEYGAMVVNAFEFEKELVKGMFKTNTDDYSEPKQCFYFDVPLIINHQSSGIRFIAALC